MYSGSGSSGLFRQAAWSFLIAFVAAFLTSQSAGAATDDQYKSAGGIAAYLGIMPAELIKGHPKDHPESTMHPGGKKGGPHEYHLVVALFDVATGARIEDATVHAQVSGLGLAGEELHMQPMSIADTVTYGCFFTLPEDIYTIRVKVRRNHREEPVVLDFKFDHRRR